jgi:hypothetical protein
MVIYHIELGDTIFARNKRLITLTRSGEISLGGNKRLKIYGTLNCSSGKRMKIGNRVFFASETEATNKGYRPCGNCMKNEYQNWKNGLI